MWTGNVPNDIMQNIDPITLVITLPIMDRIVYPALRRYGINLGPIFRISLGFFFAAVGMAYTAGIQSMIYANTSEYPISAGYQIPSYVFVAFSEVFASVVGNEYAYKKAPQSMKSIVMALFLLTNCFASILGFALVSVAVDPKLTWMYTGIGCASFICSILIYIIHHKNDATDMEDDAIGRTGDAQKEYESQGKKATEVEYELEKN